MADDDHRLLVSLAERLETLEKKVNRILQGVEVVLALLDKFKPVLERYEQTRLFRRPKQGATNGR